MSSIPISTETATTGSSPPQAATKSKRIRDGEITSFFQKKSPKLNESGSSSPIRNTDPEIQNEQGGNFNSTTQPNESGSSSPVNNTDPEIQNDQGGNFNSTTQPNVVRLTQFDILYLPQDPGLRKRIVDYHPNDREIVQREYIRRGPCQPKNHDFPQTSLRRFRPEWFKNHEPWLEYSEEKDAAFCFACYLFKKEKAKGGDAFVNSGFRTWSRTNAFDTHEGNHTSSHNKSMKDLDNFKRQKSSIVSRFENHSTTTKSAYLTRLEASIKTVRFLLLQGLSFRGHDEKESSLNRGNFIELLKLLAEHDEKIAKVVLDKAPGNCILTCSDIQKEIVAMVTTSKIIQELDGDFFSILVDESADIADKEQMALCLRYVDKVGELNERLLGVVHVGDTTSLTLKEAIAQVFKKFSLTFSRLRGQGYDGASNMQGSLNGLKTLILKESPSAYSVHCFAHQLQLIVVAVAKKSHDCSWLLETLTNLLNLIASSPKRKEILRVKQAEQVLKELNIGETKSGSGQNQERGLSRPGDTRWHSHFKTILSVLTLYPSILEVIDVIGETSTGADNVKAESISYVLRSFDFIFVAHLMVKIFGITNELNLSLQRKELDIVNAIKLVEVTKKALQHLRDDGWDCHLKKVSEFCSKHGIEVPCMNASYVIPGRHRRGRREVENLRHFRAEVFYYLIDEILQEFGNRFDERSKELLVCMSCFNPQDRFACFDSKKLLQLAKYYPSEFSENDLLFFECQLDTFKYDVQSDDRFWNIKSLNELSMKLVETKKHLTHSKVYLLLKLVLVLPVATATVERAFSAMTFIKNKLRNSMGDEWLNDLLVTFVERDVFLKVTIDEIVHEFMNMRTRRIV